MDWSTVLVSTSLSAVVGAMVSLLSVSQTTTRQRRAERHDDARQKVEALLAPIRLKLRRYQSGMSRSAKREDGSAIYGDDYVLLCELLAAADNLSRHRRWLVHRRARRLFGDFLVYVAEVSPATGDSLGAVLSPLLVASRSDVPGVPEQRVGLLHEAFLTDPGSPELRDLDKQLRRLAAAR